MAVAAMSAAALAYRKETKKAREKGNKTRPAWMDEVRATGLFFGHFAPLHAALIHVE